MEQLSDRPNHPHADDETISSQNQNPNKPNINNQQSKTN
jgi:hypothetical protein